MTGILCALTGILCTDAPPPTGNSRAPCSSGDPWEPTSTGILCALTGILCALALAPTGNRNRAQIFFAYAKILLPGPQKFCSRRVTARR